MKNKLFKIFTTEKPAYLRDALDAVADYHASKRILENYKEIPQTREIPLSTRFFKVNTNAIASTKNF